MSTLAGFLQPTGFARPSLVAALREGSVVAEGARYVVRSHADRRTRRHVFVGPAPRDRSGAPVLLIPGFLAGDSSLGPLARGLREEGFRTYRSRILANVGCTRSALGLLEQRLEVVAERRGAPVHIVGHSLGGLLARGLAVRRPDLVAGIVTLGSPLLAPGAHHVSLTASLEVLVRLSRVGIPGLMSQDCVAGWCAQESFEESRLPLGEEVGFTSIYSRRDGVVDWRACLDPHARAIEVSSSHTGMALDPRVRDHVVEALGDDGSGARAGARLGALGC